MVVEKCLSRKSERQPHSPWSFLCFRAEEDARRLEEARKFEEDLERKRLDLEEARLRLKAAAEGRDRELVEEEAKGSKKKSYVDVCM